MRVAIVYGSSAPVPPVRGIAPGIVIYNTVEHLRLEPGDELVVFSRWEPELDELVYDRIRYHSVKVREIIQKAINAIKKLPYRIYHPLLSAWFGQTDNDWLGYAFSLIFQVRAFHPDVIVCHVNYKLPSLLRRACPKAKILYYHHGSNMHLRLSATEWQTFQKKLDGLVSVSQAAIDGIEKNYGAIRIPHWVIHNGVDEQLFYPGLKEEIRETVRSHYQTDTQDFVFLYAGRIHPTKGLHHLVQAFIKLVDERSCSRLWIAGSASQENRPDFEYEQKLKELVAVLPERITFTGWFPNEDMPALMAAADAFVLAAVTEEGIPLSLLESMACGTPVIATRIGGIPEIVQHAEMGLLIPPENLETELGAAMQTFLRDRSLWQFCSLHSAEVVQEHHTYSHVAGQFRMVLDAFRK